MRKRKTVIILCAVLAAGLLLAGVILTHSFSFRVGRCLMADNGSCLLLMDGSPIVLSNHTLSDAPFQDYRTGDVLLVLHDGIMETYPGRTGCYFALRLHQGDINDVPQSVVTALTELGWTITQ